MKLIVAGSRDFNNYGLVSKHLNYLHDRYKIDVIICGLARGADLLGKRWGLEHKVEVQEFPADWGTYGKSAGYRRNEEMSAHATYVIAFWDGESRGTKHMIDIATAQLIPVAVVNYVTGRCYQC